MAISQGCLQMCLEALLIRRKEAEGRVEELSAAPSPKRSDFDKGTGFPEAVAMATANKNAAFESLRKINLRADAIKGGRFKGICPQCGKDMAEQILIETPMRELCLGCQKKKNGKGAGS